MSRGRIALAVIGLLVVAGVVAGVFWNRRANTAEVSVQEVVRGDLEVLVSASGKLEADVKADITPPTTGRLASVEVVDGQEVKAGQVVAMMDTEPLELQVEQARAAYRAAKAQVSVLRNQGATSEQKAAAASQVSAAQSAYESAQEAYDALADLYEETPEDLQPAVKVAMDTAQGQVTQADGAVKAAQAQQSQLESAKVSREQVEAAEAQADQASAALRLAQKTLDEATLKAPIDGTLIFNSGSSSLAGLGAAAAAAGAGAGAGASGSGGDAGRPQEGAFVSPQSPPFSVVRLDTLRFNAGVDESEIAKVKTGLTAAVILDAFPDKSFETTVASLKPTSQQTPTGGTVFPVLMPLAHVGERLFIGMTGNADIRIRLIEQAVVVPIEALIESDGTDYVWVMEDGRGRKREIDAGVLTDTHAEVLKGLEPGEDVIVNGFEDLEDGQAVRVE